MKFNEMTVNELYNLYEKKYTFVKTGNLPELIKLKNEFPEIFLEENEKAFTEIVETTEFLMQLPHIQEGLLAEKKKRLVPMDYDQWQLGMVDAYLIKLPKISFKHMFDVSRAFVKESIIQCQSICLQHGFNIELELAFPLLSHLINEILVQFPLNKRPYQLKTALFKIRGEQAIPSKMNEPLFAFSEWEKDIFSHAAIKLDLCQQFRESFKKIRTKFDSREGYYTDALFFFLMEVSEFIGLLIPTLGNISQAKQFATIGLMNKMITISDLSHVIEHPFCSDSQL